MARTRRKAATTTTPHVDPSAGWTRSKHFVAESGRHVEPGTEVSIKGERGRFRFVEHVVTDKGAEWISVVGGPKGVSTWRAFRPERIRRVHVKRERMTPEEARRLVNEKNRQKRSGR